MQKKGEGLEYACVHRRGTWGVVFLLTEKFAFPPLSLFTGWPPHDDIVAALFEVHKASGDLVYLSIIYGAWSPPSHLHQVLLSLRHTVSSRTVFPDSELNFVRDFIVNVFAGAKPPIYTRFAAIVARSRWFAVCQHTCIYIVKCLVVCGIGEEDAYWPAIRRVASNYTQAASCAIHFARCRNTRVRACIREYAFVLRILYIIHTARICVKNMYYSTGA